MISREKDKKKKKSKNKILLHLLTFLLEYGLYTEPLRLGVLERKENCRKKKSKPERNTQKCAEKNINKRKIIKQNNKKLESKENFAHA